MLSKGPIFTEAGDPIYVFMDDRGPIYAIKATGGIGQYRNRLQEEYPAPNGLEWIVASDVLAYPVKMGWG